MLILSSFHVSSCGVELSRAHVVDDVSNAVCNIFSGAVVATKAELQEKIHASRRETMQAMEEVTNLRVMRLIINYY